MAALCQGLWGAFEGGGRSPYYYADGRKPGLGLGAATEPWARKASGGWRGRARVGRSWGAGAPLRASIPAGAGPPRVGGGVASGGVGGSAVAVGPGGARWAISACQARSAAIAAAVLARYCGGGGGAAAVAAQRDPPTSGGIGFCLSGSQAGPFTAVF